MKYLIIVLLSGLILAGCTSSTVSNSFYTESDKGDCKANRFDSTDPALDPDFEWKKDSLYVRWDQYSGEEFDGYYIVRDETDTCPFYFVGGDYHEYIGKSSKTLMVDEVESGATYYYRICVREDDREVGCGSVSKVIIK